MIKIKDARYRKEEGERDKQAIHNCISCIYLAGKARNKEFKMP